MAHAIDLLKVGGGAVAVGGVAWALLRRPRCLLLPVDQGEDWVQRFQAGTDWRLKIRLRARIAEADRLELRLDEVELRDARERRLDIRRSIVLPLEPVRVDDVQDQWVTIPTTASPRSHPSGDVRRLRIVGTVRARRRWGFARSEPFALDMLPSGSFEGAQVRAVRRSR